MEQNGQRHPPTWAAIIGVLVALIGVLVALFALIFGDNIYQQITGRSIFESTVQPPDQSAESIAPTPTRIQINTEIPPVNTSSQVFQDEFDDAINQYGAWTLQVVETCNVAQGDGMLVVKNLLSQSHTYCDLILSQPSVSLDNFGTVEARIKITDDFSGDLVNHGIRIHHVEGWYAFCGLAAHVGGIETILDLGWQIDAWERTSPADYDRWYTFRLEVDPQTAVVSCWVDNNLLGSITPENVSRLINAQFTRELASARLPNSLATTSVDYFRISP